MANENEKAKHVFDIKTDGKLLRDTPQFLKRDREFQIIQDETYQLLDEILTSFPPGKSMVFSRSGPSYERHPSEYTKNLDGTWSCGLGLDLSNWNIINVMCNHAGIGSLCDFKIIGKAAKVQIRGENGEIITHPSQPAENPKLKRIAPTFGPGDEFVRQLNQMPEGSTVDYGRHGVFVKRNDGKWDMYNKQNGSKLKNPVPPECVDYYAMYGMHGMYIPTDGKEQSQPSHKVEKSRKKNTPER